MAHNIRNVDPSNVEAEILTNDEQEELTNLVLEALEAEGEDLSEEEVAMIAGWLVCQVLWHSLALIADDPVPLVN